MPRSRPHLQRFQLRHGPDSAFLAVAFLLKKYQNSAVKGTAIKFAALLALFFDK
jgi:hypothetical protein